MRKTLKNAALIIFRRLPVPIITLRGLWLNMDLPGLRTWVVFYLISFVVLLWSAFLSAQGVMLWVSLLLVILIVGVNFITVLNQVKAHAARKEFLRDLTSGLQRKQEGEVESPFMTQEEKERH
jgi:hypothetical protein